MPTLPQPVALKMSLQILRDPSSPHILPLRATNIATQPLSARQASTAAPSIPRSHFSSLARLDQDRLSAMLAEELSSEKHQMFSSEPLAATAAVVSRPSTCFGLPLV